MNEEAKQESWEVWPIEELWRLMSKARENDYHTDLPQGWGAKLVHIVAQLLKHFADLPEALFSFLRGHYFRLAGHPARRHPVKPFTLHQALQNLGVVLEEFDVHAVSDQKTKARSRKAVPA